MLANRPRHLNDKQLLSQWLNIPLRKLRGKNFAEMLERYVRTNPENEQASQIFEFCLRYDEAPMDIGMSIMTPLDVGRYFGSTFIYAKKEHAHVLCLDNANNVIHCELLSVGTVDRTYIHPREVFKAAVEVSATSIILVHNHTTDIPEASTADIEVTRRIRDAGYLMGIPLIDHVIISREDICSLLKEKEYYPIDKGFLLESVNDPNYHLSVLPSGRKTKETQG